MSDQRRHHFVQRAYLERFAENGQIFVRRRDGKAFVTSTVNAAVEVGFYDVLDDSGERSTEVERRIGQIEDPAIKAMRRIDAEGMPPDVGSADRDALASYLGLQMSRTPETRERILFSRHVLEYAEGREVTRELVANYLKEVHLREEPSSKEAGAAFDFVSINLNAPETLTQEFAIAMMLRSMEEVAPVLSDLSWTIEFDRKSRLITSDSPLIIWRHPSPRDQFEGVGVANAEEVRFPLDPSKQLVMSPIARTPTVRIGNERSHESNADVASACHRSIFAHPRGSDHAKRLILAERRPVLRFNSGPLFSEEGERLEGDVLHTWVPRRQPEP